MNTTPRRQKVIHPRFQLRLVGSFVGLAALAMMLQFLVLGARLSSVVQGLEGGSGELADRVPQIVLQTLVVSAAVLLPILSVLGVLLTFRVAGPVYRFEQYMRSLAKGEVIGPCKIREGDELQSMCDAVNEVSAELREHRLAAARRERKSA